MLHPHRQPACNGGDQTIPQLLLILPSVSLSLSIIASSALMAFSFPLFPSSSSPPGCFLSFHLCSVSKTLGGTLEIVADFGTTWNA